MSIRQKLGAASLMTVVGVVAGVVTSTLLNHHTWQAAASARVSAGTAAITYVDFITVMLTALGVILAALALTIALLAVWGYSGIREETTKAVYKQAQEAIEKKIGEYPDAHQVFTLFDEIRQFHEQQKLLSNQLASASDPKSVARASKRVQDSQKSGKPLAREYPGKGD